MEENDSIAEKDLPSEEKIMELIMEKVNIGRLNGKNTINLSDGKSIILIKLLKDEESDYIEIDGKKISIAKKKELIKNDLKTEIDKYKNKFDFNKMYLLNLKRNILAYEYNNLKNLGLESELNEALKEGRATKLRTGREFTEGEDLSLMFNRMFGVRTHEVYRVKNKENAHGFKYICKDNSGKFVEPNGSKRNEGKRPTQKCWVQENNGKFIKKTFDDMQIFGNYALATDIPDNVINEHTRTLIGTRCPSRRIYIYASIG